MAADKAVKPSEMTIVTSVANTDLFIVTIEVGTANANTAALTAQTLFSNVTANNLFINYDVTPTANNDNVGGRRIWWDASYLYVALSNTNIRRIPLETF